MWDVNDKKILVIGAARSGLGVAEYLHEKGARVTLTDSKPAEKLGDIIIPFYDLGIELVLGREPEICPGTYDFAVVSPGVPLTVPLVRKITELRIPLIGELETAFRDTTVPYIAITGTNGKTTTTALTGQIFQDAGRQVFVGGNIGTPLTTGIKDLTPRHVVVAEVSSFQLETIDFFRPKVSVIINITPDHLDRHGNMGGYTAAKARIFENQMADDYTVLNYDDLRVRALAEKTAGRVVFFSRKVILENGVYTHNGEITVDFDGIKAVVIPREEIFIKGEHNLENALAAVAVSVCMGIETESIARTLKSFPGVAHRLEYVADIDGVTYINDSKGTNPDSTIKALEAYDRPVILIAGGKNKGGSFDQLAQLVKTKARAVVLLGETAPIIKEALELQGFSSIIQAHDFSETVYLAQKAALPGDIVLLSPACASWDMFNNFEERGNLFKALVMEMKKE